MLNHSAKTIVGMLYTQDNKIIHVCQPLRSATRHAVTLLLESLIVLCMRRVGDTQSRGGRITTAPQSCCSPSVATRRSPPVRPALRSPALARRIDSASSTPNCSRGSGNLPSVSTPTPPLGRGEPLGLRPRRKGWASLPDSAPERVREREPSPSSPECVLRAARPPPDRAPERNRPRGPWSSSSTSALGLVVCLLRAVLLAPCLFQAWSPELPLSALDTPSPPC